MTDINLDKLVTKAVDRANNLVEQLTGTTSGSIINAQKNHLLDLVKQNEMNLASIAVLELIDTCKMAEELADEY